MSRIRAACRKHSPFLIILPLLIIVMTWPTIVRVFDVGALWLPGKSTDLFFKIWDVWYIREVLAGRADFLYTDLQFYPRGMSLAFHQFSLPHSIAVGFLQSFMPFPGAINLGFLLMLFANASSMYLLLTYIFNDRWISLFGAALVGVCPALLRHQSLPDLSLMASIPLAMYLMLRSINEQRLSFALFAGLAAGVAAFVSMYMLVCTALTLGIVAVSLAASRWRCRGFWLQMAILLCACASLSAIRIAPMFMDRHAFAEAATKGAHVDGSTDAMAYFVLSPNRTLSPLIASVAGITPGRAHRRSYLGYAPLLFVIIGFARGSRCRQMMPWFVMFLLFLLLRLGDTLIVNGVQYPNVPLPKPILDQVFPIMFRPFWYPNGWGTGLVLAFAVLACFGLKTVARGMSERRASLLVLALIAFTAFEFYAPIESSVIKEGGTKYIDWLKTEEQNSIRLIHVPMGRSYSKIYSLYQTFSGYPTAEGVANRTLAESYSYIDADPILSEWRRHKRIHCFPAEASAINAGLGRLLSDGFTHIVIHRWLAQSMDPPISYLHAEPAYEDDFVTVYRLQDMLESCRQTAFISDSDSAVMRLKDALADPSALRTGEGAAVLSIHPSGDASEEITRFYAGISESQPSLVLLTVDDALETEHGRAPVQELMQRPLLLLMYDPAATAPELISAYRQWVVSRFKSCGNARGATSLHIEYFAKDPVPCEMLNADSPLQVSYGNGMALSNAFLRIQGDYVDLDILWERMTHELHSVSLQLFDETGTRISGVDRTIPKDSGPVFALRLDRSSIEPGEYFAKLVVYNYETRAIVPGTVISSGLAFERELELARLTLE